MLTEELDFDSIVASSRFAFGLKDGQLWACGANDRGQLGIGPDEPSLGVFKKVSFPTPVKQVACGWEHSVLLTEDGSVFVSGGGSKGQLGLGALSKAASEFTPVPGLEGRCVKQVCCGVWFSLALCENGDVFGWGSNRDRCLSPDETLATIYTPVLVKIAPKNIVKLTAGHRHVIAMTKEGRVFSWGDNRFHQLVECDVPVRDCFAGWHHSVVQVTEKQCLIFGKNDHNQLAYSDRHICKNLIEFESPIRRIAVGSDHTLVLLQDSGKLYSFGWNEHGILGDGSNETKHGQISRVNFEGEIKEIFCGYGSCFIIVASSK